MITQNMDDSWEATRDLRRARDYWDQAGYKVAQVIRKATQLHEGCESDNQIWLVELEDGRKTVLTTCRGEACEMEYKELMEKIEETDASLKSLIDMSAWWPRILT